MDKLDFLHKLKGLRSLQAAGQVLNPGWTLTGQKNGSGQVLHFRTFAPVDMHWLIHTRPRSVSTSRAGGSVGLAEAGDFFSEANVHTLGQQGNDAEASEAALSGAGDIENRFQVYQQKVCIQNSSNG